MNNAGGIHPQANGPIEPGSIVKVAPQQLQARDPYRPYGGEQAGQADKEDLWEFVLGLWRIMMKRKGLITALALGFLAVGSLYTLMQTPLYTSTVRIQIDRSGPRIMKDGDVLATETNDSAEFMRTQIELLLSRSLAERVVTAARLADEPNLIKSRDISPWAAAGRVFGIEPATGSTGRAALERRSHGVVLLNRGVKPVAGSRLVDLSFSDPNPALAQRVANAYGDEYIASTLDKRFQANAYAKTFLEDQVNQLKAKLEEQEKTLLEFAEKEQIIVVNERASIAETNLGAANTALGNLVTERIKHEQQWKLAETANGLNLPQVLSNATVESLRQRRYTLVTEYQEKLETFKPGYPAMVQINSKIKEVDRQLVGELETIKKSLNGAYQSTLNQENEMKARIEELRGEVLDLQKRSIQYTSMKREVDSTRQIYNGLLQRFKEVDVAGGMGANNIFVVDRALAPSVPSSPNVPRSVLISLLLGLGVGMMSAYVLERLDDTIRAPEQLESIARVATLGIIPKVETDQMEAQFNDPRSGLAESYRSLCTGLQFSTDSGLPKTMLITSAGPAEGKSSTALAISRHFASMGLKVLLIDADLRNPSLHKKLNLENTTGLSNYLTGACSPPDAFQRTSLPNLAFMPSGPLPPNAADILASPKLGSLLNVGLEVFDFIVLDGPPVMGLADAPILSNAAMATVFVAGAGQARLGHVRGALRRLQMARSPVIGTILTKYEAKMGSYGYGYGYSYGYGYGYGYGGAGYGKESSEPGKQLVKS